MIVLNRLTVPKIRRARRLRRFRRRNADAELVRFWGETTAERRSDRLREMLDGVAAGHTYTIYHDANHTRPLAVVIPYPQYERLKEALRQFEVLEESDDATDR